MFIYIYTTVYTQALVFPIYMYTNVELHARIHAQNWPVSIKYSALLICLSQNKFCPIIYTHEGTHADTKTHLTCILTSIVHSSHTAKHSQIS